MDQRRFQLNEPDVSAEDFQNEILAVNLRNGYYYSLRGSGVAIWRLLMEGWNAETIVQGLAPVYRGEAGALAADVSSFIAELEKASLIVASPREPEVATVSAPSWFSALSSDYAKPLMETYAEMQDLLLLDPIHDVDLSGWPHLPESKADEPADKDKLQT